MTVWGGLDTTLSTVSQVQLDLDQDGVFDFVMAFSSPQSIAADLTSGNEEAFFAAALGGNDTGTLSGDYGSTTGASPGTFLDNNESVGVGGNDTVTLTGDGYIIADFRSALDGAVGGDDVININRSGAFARVEVSGDFNDTNVFSAVTVTGGNDSITDIGPAGSTLEVFGDSEEIDEDGSVLNGGDDTITGGSSRIEAYGDVEDVDGDNVTVNGGADVLIGSSTGDLLIGDVEGIRLNETGVVVNGGADSILGNMGDDFIVGDVEEIDSVFLVGGNDTLKGGDGNDVLLGQGGDDEIDGGADNDTLSGGEGNDFLDGGTGTDLAYFGRSVFAISVSINSIGPALATGNGTDTLVAIEGVIGGLGSDSIQGDGFANRIGGGEGNDTLDGGGGIDTLDLTLYEPNRFGVISAEEDFFVDLRLQGTAQSFGTQGTDLITNFENVATGRGDDTLIGDAFANVLDGGDGVDETDYTAFSAPISMALVDNIAFVQEYELTIGVVVDTLLNIEVINLGSGNDTLTLNQNLTGFSNVIDGGGGTDLITLIASGEVRNIDLTTTFVGFENVLGSSNDENVTGGTGANNLQGFGGNDTLIGGGGADTLIGGSGEDSLEAGPDAATLRGQANADTLMGGDGADDMSGGEGVDSLSGGDEADTLRGQGDGDSIDGGDGSDVITGGAGADSIDGGAGDDDIIGQGQGDTINGGAGNDTVLGGSGNDLINGGEDNDDLSGSGNNDTLNGDDGNDLLSGAAGLDELNGGSGDDTLNSGSGADTLDGGAGNDRMNGGGADGVRDVFIFGLGYEADRINAFDQLGTDQLRLDDALWLDTHPGGLTEQQVIDTFGTLNGTGTILTLDFGGGDVLEVQNRAGIDQATLGADVFIF